MGLLYEIRRPEAEKEKLTRSYLCPGAMRVIPDFTESSLGYLGILCDPDDKGVVLDIDADVADRIKEEVSIDAGKLDGYPVLLSLNFNLITGKVNFKPEPTESGQIVISQYEPGLN